MPRRVTLIIALVVGAGLLGGLGLLLLPYTAPLEAPGTLMPPSVDVPCKPPLIDSFTSEADDLWLNYSPEDGTKIGGGRTGDGYCYPESFRRSLIGSMVTITCVGMLMGLFMLDRRDRAKLAAAAAEGEGAEDSEPEAAPTPDDVAEPDANPETAPTE